MRGGEGARAGGPGNCPPPVEPLALRPASSPPAEGTPVLLARSMNGTCTAEPPRLGARVQNTTGNPGAARDCRVPGANSGASKPQPGPAEDGSGKAAARNPGPIGSNPRP